MPNPKSKDTQPATQLTLPKFGLRLLFYVTAVYAVGMVLGSWTIFLSTVFLIFWRLVSFNRGWGRRFLIVLFLAMMLAPSGPRVYDAARRTECLNNIRQLSMALLNYESSHGRFVMADRQFMPSEQAIPPQTGQRVTPPPVSWRVTILPYIEEEKLYRRYRFDEPWDGPNNIQLLKEMPSLYECPSHRDSIHHDSGNPNSDVEQTAGCTPYKLVADTGTAFEPGRSISFGDILDGSSNTLGIVEDVVDPVPWTKPEDLTIEQAIAVLAPQDLRHVAHVHRGQFETSYTGSNVSLLDGGTLNLSPGGRPEFFRKLCLINDGAMIDIYDHSGRSIQRAHPERYIVLVIYILLLLLPGITLPHRR